MVDPTIMLVAAEASGDALGAALARALRAGLPNVRFIGVGGAGMAGEGGARPFDLSPLPIPGVFQGVKAHPRVLRPAPATPGPARPGRPGTAAPTHRQGFTPRRPPPPP